MEIVQRCLPFNFKTPFIRCQMSEVRGPKSRLVLDVLRWMFDVEARGSTLDARRSMLEVDVVLL